MNSRSVSSNAALSIAECTFDALDIAAVAWKRAGLRSSAVVINTMQFVRYFSILLAELLFNYACFSYRFSDDYNYFFPLDFAGIADPDYSPAFSDYYYDSFDYFEESFK